MGPRAAAIAFKQGELAIGQHTEPVFSAIEVPEVDRSIGCPADATSTKAPQGHAVVGAIVEVAGVADRVGVGPAQAKRPAPARLGRLPTLGLLATAQQRTQSRESERGHGEAESRPSLPELRRQARGAQMNTWLTVLSRTWPEEATSSA
jgi:hypothetical protein